MRPLPFSRTYSAHHYIRVRLCLRICAIFATYHFVPCQCLLVFNFFPSSRCHWQGLRLIYLRGHTCRLPYRYGPTNKCRPGASGFQDCGPRNWCVYFYTVVHADTNVTFTQDLKTKHTVACELRNMVDTVKDSETPRVVPIVMAVIVDRLKNMDPSFQKDTIEYAFRRVLIEILHRLPLVDTMRPQAALFCAGLLHVVSTDSEENAITCCKLTMEVVRNFRPLNGELVGQFFNVLHTIFHNIPSLVVEYFSEDSLVIDPNAVIPSVRSFKVFAEMATLVVILLQNHRSLVSPVVHENLQLHFETMSVQSPAQRKAREDYEAMGGYWAGVAPTVPNMSAYADLILAQVKVRLPQRYHDFS
jgi:hypothetical protein